MSKLLDQHENLMDEWMSEHGIATERAQMKARIAELEVALTTARREGAEAMRERAAREAQNCPGAVIERFGWMEQKIPTRREIAAAIRALPLENEPGDAS